MTRGDDIIGRAWPAAMSEADMETPLCKTHTLNNQPSTINFLTADPRKTWNPSDLDLLQKVFDRMK
jgi:hypothetical protein